MWRWQHVPRRAREAPAARRLASGGDAGQRGSRRRDDDCAGGPIPGAESGDHEVRSTPLSPPFFHVSERTACPRVPRAAWRCSARASGLRLSAERGLHDFPNRLVYRAVHVRGRAGARGCAARPGSRGVEACALPLHRAAFGLAGSGRRDGGWRNERARRGRWHVGP